MIKENPQQPTDEKSYILDTARKNFEDVSIVKKNYYLIYCFCRVFFLSSFLIFIFFFFSPDCIIR